MSGGFAEIDKYSSYHRYRRTSAMVSENVAQSFRYHAACRTGMSWWTSRSLAINVTSEYKARMTGVVRAMAGGGHCRRGCMSRGGGGFSKGASIFQRLAK